PGWDELSLKQKAYAYYLSEAAKFGYDIHWDQNCKHNLQLRHALEKILTSYSGDKENQEYRDFEEYAKRVFFSAGIHHHYAEDKFFPKCSQEFFTTLLNSVGADTELLIPYIYDPALFPQRRSTSVDGDIVKLSAVNFYDGVSRQEVEEYYRKIQDPDDPHPVAYGLNTKVVKENGKVVEKAWKADGIYGPAITKICEMLSKAREYAESESQRKALDLLIGYYNTGDLREWDAYNIEWLQDTTGTIDYVNGFIEDYNDPLGRKGSWEGHVNIKDASASQRSTILSDNAQWFEDHSPVDARFKKEKVKGVSAKVINAVCLSGDAFPSTPIGINLPNQDWIRRDHGSKSVTIANITDAYTFSAAENPKNGLDEFEHDEAVKARERKYGSHSDNIHTDLHECLGHGSGKLLPGVSSTAMGEFSSTLEEARADLFGLWYCADSKMVELGIMPDMEAYKAAYSKFIRNGLMVQFSRIELGRNNTEAHMQDRQLIAQWCFENGNGVIRKVTDDGKTYFEITDYEALRGLFGKLLAEIQRIKSEGDYAAGKALVEKYAVKIDYDLHREVIERYTALELKPYGGFINPTIIPVVKNGETIDYKLEYPSDFLGQMLEYGAKYGTL
ncbi:MAG: dihydrofolate reductase, partial [Alistipes sp.]|nr:dihydrofolate reductase [Candidatus Minthomonas equi]